MECMYSLIERSILVRDSRVSLTWRICPRDGLSQVVCRISQVSFDVFAWTIRWAMVVYRVPKREPKRRRSWRFYVVLAGFVVSLPYFVILSDG